MDLNENLNQTIHLHPKILDSETNNTISLNNSNLKLTIDFSNCVAKPIRKLNSKEIKSEKNHKSSFEKESLSPFESKRKKPVVISNTEDKGFCCSCCLQRKLSNFACESNTNFSRNSILKHSENYKILKLSNDEIIKNILGIVSESKEYAIFFLSNSQDNEEIKEKIKFYAAELKVKFNRENLLEIFKLFIHLSEKADPKFKEYLFKCDLLGYNLTHYLSALSNFIL